MKFVRLTQIIDSDDRPRVKLKEHPTIVVTRHLLLRTEKAMLAVHLPFQPDGNIIWRFWKGKIGPGAVTVC